MSADLPEKAMRRVPLSSGNISSASADAGTHAAALRSICLYPGGLFSAASRHMCAHMSLVNEMLIVPIPSH